MSEQADRMREMAQTTLDSAKEAVSKYMTESQKMRDRVDSGMRSSYSSMKEMNDKAVAFAEANVSAGFDLAQKILDAKDPKEISDIYQNHLKEQIEKMTAQFRELGALISEAAPVDLKK
jgi:hypothetical protein